MDGAMTPAINSTEDLHEFRKQIDACIQKARAFGNGYFVEAGSTKGKRENALVITKLQEAKMWVGKVLEEVGSELPKEFQDKAE
jgi:hypothetical protein